MNFDEIVTIDFETEAITSALPPKPIGVAVKVGGADSFYYGWGHKDKNNSLKDAVGDHLRRLFKHHPILCHNGAFDLAICRHYFDLPFPKEIHDTLLLLFLRDPHAKTLSLKPCAEEILGLPPEEQDLVKDWILANVPKATPKTFGAYICEAPFNLVAPYARGDVDRTFELFKVLWPLYNGEAYYRERRLLPILIENTLTGINLDVEDLEKDYDFYTTTLKAADENIYTHLKTASFNIDSSEELASAIDGSDVPINWVMTPSGKKSTSKVNLLTGLQDPYLLDLLNYRSTLATYLGTFYKPWLEKQQNGRIHFSWNQVRNQEQDVKHFTGTRTGRLSSTPSMLNVPKEPPKFNLSLPPLPSMRRYLLPDEGDYWLSRDYSGQELRVLAHYEDGALMRAYQENPWMDLHQMMAEKLTSILYKEIPRKATKTIAFAIIYGAGIAKLAAKLNCSMHEAGYVNAMYLQELPGIRMVQRLIKKAWDNGEPFKTWGGRHYFKELPHAVKDKVTGLERLADFGYKGMNYLIQGSASDITKQAIINYDSIKKDGRFLLSVHDQLDISGPLSEMPLLKEAMLDIKIDVPMVSEGKFGPDFGELQVFEEEAA